MSRFDTSTNHPLIPNSQEYVIEKKYVSIHSEDINFLKYPKPSDFEMELPEDYLNVQSVKLSTWSFPSNYDTFSFTNQNLSMCFSFTNVFLPVSPTPLQQQIFSILTDYTNNIGTNDILVTISPGFYVPIHMSRELTNRFNESVTTIVSKGLINYDTQHGTHLNNTFVTNGGYGDFVIVYNEVDQKIWFGNRSSAFSLTQNIPFIQQPYSNEICVTKSASPDSSVIGLPTFVGLDRCPISAIQVPVGQSYRFYYGDVVAGDNGFWLVPNSALPGCSVYYASAKFKLNNMGPSYIYMMIDGLNNIDETRPFNISRFTTTTNDTNAIVNSAFAKIPIVSTPLSQYFDNTMDSYKYFIPPAEKIRRLRIRLRYHNGELVDFGTFPFTFTLEFTMLTPQINRKMHATSSYLS